MHTLRRALALALILATDPATAADPAPRPTPITVLPEHPDATRRLIQAALASDRGYRRLQELCDTFGHRHTGSTNLAAAATWVLNTMRHDRLANVRGEEVQVPRWVRGQESALLLEPRHQELPMLGLGGSVGTPPAGITAPVLVVQSFEELAARAAEARHRIVLFAAPFVSYGQSVAFRVRGPSEAAKAGAVACLIRSVTPISLRSPHTGTLRYAPDQPKIPAAALTTEDADMLARLQARGLPPVVRLHMEARSEGDVTSHNLIGELPGRERPEEIVVVSGHFDSWDVGQGAQDDGAACIAAWEAALLIRDLGLQPRRTLRVVLWTDEETGGRGARSYVERHRQALAQHVLAIESDTGTYPPLGFRFAGTLEALQVMRTMGALLEPLGAGHITLGGADADISKLLAEGVPAASLSVRGDRYFWVHHAEADTVDKVDPADLQRCTAALAVLAYLAADWPHPLPR